MVFYFILFYFLRFIYLLKKFFFQRLFIFGTERDRAWTGEGQRERETQNRKQAPGSEPSVQSLTRGSNSRTARSWPGWSRTLNRLHHPGAPEITFKKSAYSWWRLYLATFFPSVVHLKMVHLITDSILNLMKYGNPDVTIRLLEALWCYFVKSKRN